MFFIENLKFFIKIKITKAPQASKPARLTQEQV